MVQCLRPHFRLTAWWRTDFQSGMQEYAEICRRQMLLKLCNDMYSRMNVYTERDREGFSVGARHIHLRTGSRAEEN